LPPKRDIVAPKPNCSIGVLATGMRIELNCAKCGKNSFDLGHGAEDGSVIRCNGCGHKIGTMQELKERVAAEVLKRAANRD
jgi:DNA-directed RNA polymerase subunit RPC12/RpoP